MNRRNLLLFASIYFFIIFIFAILSINANKFLLHNDKDLIIIEASDFVSGEYDMSYRLLNRDDEKIQVFKTNIAGKDFSLLKAESYKLMIYRFNSQGYRVIFNGINIGSIGDFEKGKSNIWNSMGSFTIDRKFIKSDNELQIRAISLYNTGLSGLPVLIASEKKSMNLMSYFDGIVQFINSASIGLTLFGVAILLLLYFLSAEKPGSYIYFALALSCISVYAFDYINIYYLPFSYLVYKKFIMFALHSAVSFASIAIYKHFGGKINVILAFITILGYLSFSLFINDMLTFKIFYDHYNIIIIFNIFSWIYVSIRNLRKSEDAKVFLVGCIFIAAFCSYDVIMNVFNKNYDINTLFFYALTFILIPITLVFKDFAEKNRRIELESQKRLKIYEKSIKDGMTGLYNHQYMFSVLSDLEPPYTIAMLDVDNFKEINDNYGHRIGDLMIEHIAQKLKEFTRKSDMICRYGGDEFVVVLFDCSAEVTKEIIEKVRNAVKILPDIVKNLDIKVTLSAGIYQIEKPEDINNIIHNVDCALYHSKRSGKDKVSIFNTKLITEIKKIQFP